MYINGIYTQFQKILKSFGHRLYRHAPGSPGALIQMQIKRSIFKIYHLGTPCFRNDLCPNATNIEVHTHSKMIRIFVPLYLKIEN